MLLHFYVVLGISSGGCLLFYLANEGVYMLNT